MQELNNFLEWFRKIQPIDDGLSVNPAGVGKLLGSGPDEPRES